MDKIKQLINTLKLTPNIKLFGVSFGSTDDFGAINVSQTPDWTKDTELPTSKAAKDLVDESVNNIKSKVFTTEDEASEDNEGLLKYEKTETSSTLSMCMQTDVDTYEFVIIKYNEWVIPEPEPEGE